jgi:uncharacterized protein
MNSMYPKKSMARKTLLKQPESKSKTGKRKTIEVRASGIHGRGVFAVTTITAGTRVIEYTGPIITWKEAQRRHPHNPDEPNHTFFFHIDDKRVIDGLHGGPAKWINHACDANCEADEDEAAGRVFIKALRDIAPGDELNYDYGLVLEGRHTKKIKKDYECRCGSKKCRGTMLSPKR